MSIESAKDLSRFIDEYGDKYRVSFYKEISCDSVSLYIAPWIDVPNPLPLADLHSGKYDIKEFFKLTFEITK